MNKPLVSVIMPIFNKGLYVAQAIESVLRQSEQRFELLLLDDGSSDESFSIAKLYAQKDARIRAWTKPNGGPVAALNELVAAAKAPVLALLDADDWWLPERLAWGLADLAQDEGLAGSFCSMRMVDAAGIPTGNQGFFAPHTMSGPGLVQHLVVTNCLVASSAVLRAASLKAVDGPFRPFDRIYDWDLWLRLAAAANLKLRSTVGVVYREHEGNWSSQHVSDQMWQGYRVQKEVAGMVVAHHGLGKEVLAAVYGKMAQTCFALNQYELAAQHYLQRSLLSPLAPQEARNLAASFIRGNQGIRARTAGHPSTRPGLR